jgi:uncharacterized membrane protein SpoIIM required for sporulation
VPAPALSSRWVEKRRAHWARLEALVAQGRRGVSGLSHAELRELGQLYRQTAADLSTVRERPAGAQLAAYLNQLLGGAHNLVYSPPPARLTTIARFFSRTFPQVFRDTWQYTASAALIFAAGAAAGLALAILDPGFVRFVIGGEMMDTIDRREMWTHSILAIKPVASSAILTNNLSVSFAACATGIIVGLGPIYMMAFNGLLMSAIGAACHRAGMDLSLWSFVAPHGALELPAIFIAGGAGLLIARGLLFPGWLSRRESLAAAASVAVRLVLGVIPLLIVAGILEGFVSPTSIPAAAKFATGLAMFVALAVYLLQSGRTRGQFTERHGP